MGQPWRTVYELYKNKKSLALTLYLDEESTKNTGILPSASEAPRDDGSMNKSPIKKLLLTELSKCAQIYFSQTFTKSWCTAFVYGFSKHVLHSDPFVIYNNLSNYTTRSKDGEISGVIGPLY